MIKGVILLDIQPWVDLGGSAVVVLFVQFLVKPFVPDKRIWPIAALLLAVAVHVWVGLALSEDVNKHIAMGLLVGLAAAGVFSSQKAVRNQ